MRRVGANAPCPCGTGKKYKACCQRWHAGQPAPSPEALMRSRYTAYVVGDVGYLLRTWAFVPEDEARWRAEVRAWCEGIDLRGLVVFGAEEQEDVGQVRFYAHIWQGERDVSFGEDSRFVRVDGRWLYLEGTPVGEDGEA
jgi:SEC-C motif-containing protein